MIKKEVRVIGIDDVPFDKFRDKHTRLIGVFFRGGSYADGVVSTRISVDGTDSTSRIASMINSSKFKSQLRCIFLDGINFGGFNIVDIVKLNKLTRIPVIVVTRKKPDISNILKVLNQLGMQRKICLIEKAGVPRKAGKLHIQLAGISFEESFELIRTTATHSYLPEPIRLAHLIGAGLVLGESRGNA